MLPLARVIHLNCGTKNVKENATCFCRFVMLAVEPHSMSTVPLATSGMRVAEVTGLYLTSRFGVPRCAFTASTTCRHRSIENPTGCNLSSRYDKGTELSRCPIVKVPVSFTFFKVPSRPCILPGADAMASKQAAAAAAIAFLTTLLLLCRTSVRPGNESVDLRRRRVDRLAETVDNHVDLSGVDDERRRNQHVVAARTVRRAAHGINHQPAAHGFTFDARMHLQPRVERLLGTAVTHHFDAIEQPAPAHVTDEGMIAEALAQSARQVCALLAHVGEQAVATNHSLHRQRRRAGERMTHVGMAVLKSA